MASELKPCPFCGERLIEKSDHHGKWWAHRDEPGPCIDSVTQLFDADDYAAWNTRASPPPPDKQPEQAGVVERLSSTEHKALEMAQCRSAALLDKYSKRKSPAYREAAREEQNHLSALTGLTRRLAALRPSPAEVEAQDHECDLTCINYQGAMTDLESVLTVLIRRINGEGDLASAAEWVRLNYPKQAEAIKSAPAPTPLTPEVRELVEAAVKRIFVDSFVQGAYRVKSASGRQTAVFEDSDQFGPAFVNMRTGEPRPIPDRHWFWRFYSPWRKSGRPTEGEPMNTPCGPLQNAVWAEP